MTDSSTNPLRQYFRQPQIYIKLPSKGRFYPTGSLEMPPNNELAVFSMTAKDEILFKTPDALMNGQGTVEVIHSCIPSIKNAWEIPMVDLDTILISIRQATYGNSMEFFSICPHCKNKNEHAINLSAIIDKFNVCPDYDTTIKINDLEFYLKPQNYKTYNNLSMKLYEQQRLLAIVGDEKISEDEKTKQFTELFNRLLTLTVDNLSKAVSAIKINANNTEQVVTNEALIQEFFTNCEKNIWETVKQRIETINKEIEQQKVVKLICQNEECEKEYTTELNFETSHFFE
jgi:hypothetical protein